ncbi:dienelactone hydrolase family protein [Nannocystaceae bacterium ST9]
MQGRDIVLPAGPGGVETPAFAIVPPDARRGVVVIHEIMGRQPEIDRVVERFAAAGYAAIAPDLFARGRMACLIDVFTRAMRHGDGIAVDQGHAARDWLCEQTGLAIGQVGLIGFCFGGGYALAAGSGWGAVSTNYGSIPSTEAMRGIGPVIGCYGKRDRIFGGFGSELRERLAPLARSPEVHEYDAGHSFLTDGHHPIARRLAFPMAIGDYPEAREDAWAKILGFFDLHLR